MSGLKLGDFLDDENMSKIVKIFQSMANTTDTKVKKPNKKKKNIYLILDELESIKDRLTALEEKFDIVEENTTKILNMILLKNAYVKQMSEEISKM